MRAGPAGTILALALLGTGCAGQWILHHEEPAGRATTEFTIRTDPAGADVSVNGEYLGRSPLVVPVRYSCEVRVYERRRYLPWPHVEVRQVSSYARKFRFTARHPGYREGAETVIPAGEENREILIFLRPR